MSNNADPSHGKTKQATDVDRALTPADGAPSTPEAQAPSSYDWSDDAMRLDRRGSPNASQLAYTIDRKFFRIVVLFSGWTLIISVSGMIFLAAIGRTIPEGIVAVASGLIGLLTGTFAAKANKS